MRRTVPFKLLRWPEARERSVRIAARDHVAANVPDGQPFFQARWTHATMFVDLCTLLTLHGN